MNKIATRDDTANARLTDARGSRWQSVGARLLILLLFAEAPLVFYTCALALQNERFRAGDALSRAAAGQRNLLAQLDRDLRTAAALARAVAALPVAAIADHDSCRAVLQLLVAADVDRVQAASIQDHARGIICSSPGATGPSIGNAFAASGEDHPFQLISEGRSIYVVHPIDAGSAATRSVVITLAPIRQTTPRSGSGTAATCLWLSNAGTWRPLDCADADALPYRPASSADGPAVQSSSIDGRPFLYTGALLPQELGAEGGALLAGSDIRAASNASVRWFALRGLELAALFAAEFVLIVAGINVVVTTPLKRLNMAVNQWRAGGTFGRIGPSNDPIELRELGACFSEAVGSLDRRELELRGAIAHQDTLMKEIHHRVKNNLQIIASLLNLQASRIKGPEARAEFQSARDRVRALATLHRHLYADGELHSINMRAFFGELCSQLFQSLGEESQDRIALSIVAPEVRLSSDQAVPIALIVTETVSNAMKHAFPEPRTGTITVRLDVGAEQQAVLTVEDDGIGLTADQAPPGLGTQLVRGFAKQLDARLTVSAEHGTRYRFDMTLQLHRTENGPDRAQRNRQDPA